MDTKKPKILWIGDDVRMASGVANQGRELLLGSIKYFDFVVVAGSIQHPEKGKIINMDATTAQATGVKDAKMTLYPVDGYGNEDIILGIIDREKPDAICIMTDPRFYVWLFAIERQIRNKIPITYWALWDSNPVPRYNHSYYESVDSIFGISKQSNNLHKWVLGCDKCFTMNGEFDKEGKVILFNNETDE